MSRHALTQEILAMSSSNTPTQATPTQVRLNARPSGLTTASTWRMTHDASPALQEGDLRVAVEYISVDPAMRGWLDDVRSYLPPVALGDVMRASGVGHVLESRSPAFAAGDAVFGMTGVQSQYVGPAKGFFKVDPKLAPLPTYLGGFGSTGMTAYFGLLEVGQPKAGETVVVSAAAGAVGSVVGQLAKILGCRVVGIAGGAEKCRAVVEEFGFDACIDYQNESVSEGLKKHCPDRIDIYFDNVGGKILDTCLTRLALRARVVVCGAISQYNATERPAGPSNYLQLLVSRARMEGFVVLDYAKQFPAAIARMAGWLADGKLKFSEHVVEGLDQFPDAINMLFSGKNTGKLIVKV